MTLREVKRGLLKENLNISEMMKNNIDQINHNWSIYIDTGWYECKTVMNCKIEHTN